MENLSKKYEPGLYEFKVVKIDGSNILLQNYAGKVLLIVNIGRKTSY